MKKGLLVAAATVFVLFMAGGGLMLYSKNSPGQEQVTPPVPISTENSRPAPALPAGSDRETGRETAKVAEPDPNSGQQSPVAARPQATAQALTDNEKLSWYYKPNKEHKLPEVNPRGKALLEKYNGIYHGDTGAKNIYLTFDEGYENGYTPKILDTLQEAGIKAAFFITGDYLRKHPDLVKRMVQEGHLVGNHTDRHPSLPQISDAAVIKEIQSVSDSFAQLTGASMKYLRPPMGEYSERTLKLTRDLGYRHVFWSVALVDWRPDAGTPEQNHNTVMERLHNGAVILLHAVNKANAEMLADLIKDCQAQGYRFASLDEIR
ncbi:delta-lactam-biosynthetic de-N-acetylase [Desulforamulus hydrothermalis]|uniref:Delta-lactam-biosynthetic de-N-acetylase n=1 Tax=Desulforamulus hydrothermalis Lam5 = DSM 18033 TaxID=1121428 RepID=K8E197_9FIRM|nr:delta-lactam-biosynthetic de-N-acetylase [Desulforamulus hydrothermalis]CCO09430.1 Delta-lactam-biosynthetic de-N-acetylase [Desulforamulus hydrothermalis Lam5 = DSM 18033]SHH08323.1 peptidoglycan-N-acetylmuramic acid deacetylase [Desulforamulus hydrothermalis Lam5 = DSM 18033]